MTFQGKVMRQSTLGGTGSLPCALGDSRKAASWLLLAVTLPPTTVPRCRRGVAWDWKPTTTYRPWIKTRWKGINNRKESSEVRVTEQPLTFQRVMLAGQANAI